SASARRGVSSWPWRSPLLEASTRPSASTTNSSEQSPSWRSSSRSHRASGVGQSAATVCASSPRRAQSDSLHCSSFFMRVWAMPSKACSSSGASARFSQQAQPMASRPVLPNQGSQARSAAERFMRALRRDIGRFLAVNSNITTRSEQLPDQQQNAIKWRGSAQRAHQSGANNAPKASFAHHKRAFSTGRADRLDQGLQAVAQARLQGTGLLAQTFEVQGLLQIGGHQQGNVALLHRAFPVVVMEQPAQQGGAQGLAVIGSPLVDDQPAAGVELGLAGLQKLPGQVTRTRSQIGVQIDEQQVGPLGAVQQLQRVTDADGQPRVVVQA